MRTLMGLAVAVVTPLLAGCDQTSQNPLNVLMNGDGSVTVSVTTDAGTLAPTYGWTSDRARALTVRELGTNEVMWSVEALDPEVGFQGPVRHQVVPAGARQTAAAGLLQTGSSYQVTVITPDGRTGSAQFTP